MVYNGRASKQHTMFRFGPAKVGINDEWMIPVRGDRSPTIPISSRASLNSIAVCATSTRTLRPIA